MIRNTYSVGFLEVFMVGIDKISGLLGHHWLLYQTSQKQFNFFARMRKTFIS